MWFFPTENVTGVHLLRAAVELPEYRHLRFSVLINEEDLESLPFLYSLGLFSYHLKPMTYDSLLRDVTVLMEKVQAVDTEYQFVASGLREYLEEVKDYKTMSSLEGACMKLSILALSNLLDTFLVYLSLVIS